LHLHYYPCVSFFPVHYPCISVMVHVISIAGAHPNFTFSLLRN
jgi:hypothetical protein